MDKREINSPRLTANFLIWIAGVFMLLLFAFIANKSGPVWGHDSKRQGILEGYVRKGDAWGRSASQNGDSGNVENNG
jgi:hypothetical protein